MADSSKKEEEKLPAAEVDSEKKTDSSLEAEQELSIEDGTSTTYITINQQPGSDMRARAGADVQRFLETSSSLVELSRQWSLGILPEC